MSKDKATNNVFYNNVCEVVERVGALFDVSVNETHVNAVVGSFFSKGYVMDETATNKRVMVEVAIDCFIAMGSSLLIEEKDDVYTLLKSIDGFVRKTTNSALEQNLELDSQHLFNYCLYLVARFKLTHDGIVLFIDGLSRLQWSTEEDLVGNIINVALKSYKLFNEEFDPEEDEEYDSSEVDKDAEDEIKRIQEYVERFLVRESGYCKLAQVEEGENRGSHYVVYIY